MRGGSIFFHLPVSMAEVFASKNKNLVKAITLRGFVLLTIKKLFVLSHISADLRAALRMSRHAPVVSRNLFQLRSYFCREIFFLLFDAFADFETYNLREGKVLIYGFQILRDGLFAVFCSDISLVKQADIL